MNSKTPLRISDSDEEYGAPWAPLGQSAFRAIWIATLVSNLGGWMQDVGAAWLMTSITASPIWISLVQSAASLPIFLLALPAGALADIVARRRLLLVSNYLLLAAVSGLAICTLTSKTSPALLLAFTFAVGLGEALQAPAFQAIVSELVPSTQIVAAVSLNSVGYNLARAVGPALGGLVLARWGAGTNFLLNALSFLAVIAVLWRWRELPKKSVLPAERFTGAISAGIRYVRYSPDLQIILIRAGAFVISGSALWALLPVVVHQSGRGASAYGILLGSLGVGALIGAAMLPFVKQHLSLDAIIAFATVTFGFATLALSFLPRLSAAIFLMLAGGVGWMALVSSLNVATRMAVPAWIQARAIAVYLLVFQGGMALGSLGWGVVASRFGVRTALASAGFGLILTLPLALRYSFRGLQSLDFNTDSRWLEPALLLDIAQQSVPVLITIEYQIDPERAPDFRVEMGKMEVFRKRSGALQWGLFADPRSPGTYLEEFLVESWLEHQRQNERVTVSEQQLHNRIWAFHQGTERPRVIHFFAEEY